jgi:SOS response regulatory protein OraA/RecX
MVLSCGGIPQALGVEGPSLSEILEDAHAIALTSRQHFLKELKNKIKTKPISAKLYQEVVNKRTCFSIEV